MAYYKVTDPQKPESISKHAEYLFNLEHLVKLGIEPTYESNTNGYTVVITLTSGALTFKYRSEADARKVYDDIATYLTVKNVASGYTGF